VGAEAPTAEGMGMAVAAASSLERPRAGDDSTALLTRVLTTNQCSLVHCSELQISKEVTDFLVHRVCVY